MSTDFELAVIGGGIHGAALANYAAQSGLKVILLEKNDFASGTSSRSSKMAHGGLRYLELFDFKQVFEGIQAREELYQQAADICYPHPFFVPVISNDYWFKFKLKVGLYLYDFFQSEVERQHRYIPITKVQVAELEYKQKLMGYFQYFDGILNDVELVWSHLKQALDYGAEVYNYTEVQKLLPIGDFIQLECRNNLNQTTFNIKAQQVINASGVFASELLKQSKLESWPLRFSRGSHILFNKQWNHPALFLPLNSKARYYFVWPHFAGTLVGTTEREVTELSDNPQPNVDELKEIFSNLKKDLPASGLVPEIAQYAFAGLRVLPARNNKNTGELSRRHVWQKTGKILNLYGGKLTTAALTAKQGLENLYGAKIDIKDANLMPVFSKLDSLENKVSLAIKRFKAAKLEDLMQRRLYLEYQPDNGLSLLDLVVKIAAQQGLAISTTEIENYKSRIKQMRANFILAGS